jgi:hypothetical protein
LSCGLRASNEGANVANPKAESAFRNLTARDWRCSANSSIRNLATQHALHDAGRNEGVFRQAVELFDYLDDVGVGTHRWLLAAWTGRKMTPMSSEN